MNIHLCRSLGAALLAAGAFLVGCSGSNKPGISLNQTSLTLNEGETREMTVTTSNTSGGWSGTYPGDICYAWDTGAYSFEVEAIAPGTGTIKVWLQENNNVSASCSLTVRAVPKISQNRDTLRISSPHPVFGARYSADMRVTVSGTNSDWRIGYPVSICSVSNKTSSGYKVTADRVGSGDLRVFLVDYPNVSHTCRLTVYQFTSSAFVGGIATNGDGVGVATLWVDGEPTALSSGLHDAAATRVYFVGDDVYVEGFETDALGAAVPKLWINGEPAPVGRRAGGAAPANTFLADGVEYVAGSEKNEAGVAVATLWANGAARRLGSGERDSGASSVFVVGDDVCVAGFETGADGSPVAMLWVNGEARNLAGAANARALSVAAKEAFATKIEDLPEE